MIPKLRALVIAIALLAAGCREGAGPTGPLVTRRPPTPTSSTAPFTATATPSPRAPAPTRSPIAPTRTPTPTIPVIAGTWKGAATTRDGRQCSVTVELGQPDSGHEVHGRIQAACARASLYARLVAGIPWSLQGQALYSTNGYPYYTYRASLVGHLEGSPVSKIHIATTSFISSEKGNGDPGFRLDVTRADR